ncbi:DUF4261 domain-containing protein [Sphingomonas donggukensis]|uniref:DUF4261 domain-containing protein n=1 Tax=Sphingomonas donggukensis TaxID=2949093 RepID=A0ABY4TUR0_9SPHN|nr:DUF4261 domain-containing protein [Sphingomonas donggukensis]URW75436.1 DUF4261 domain-containing protein [Sphingomonas donggukensis]
MAVIVFSQPVPFPIAPLREMLGKYLPLYRWQCGEDDDGGAKQMGVFGQTGLIAGRSSATVIFTEYRCTLGRFPGGPAGEWYLEIFTPTTEHQAVADRIVALTAAILMIPDADDARCQLVPGGAWLAAGGLTEVVKLVNDGTSLVEAATMLAALAPGRSVEPVRTAAPRVDLSGADYSRRVLPLMLVLCDRRVQPHWAQAAEFARDLDLDGGWEVRGDALVGRGTCIAVQASTAPVPPEIWEDSYTRSFWFQGDRAAVAGHAMHLTIGSVLDTAASDFATVRQVAKVMTLLTGMIARLPGVVAVVNGAIGTIYEPDRAAGFLGILARDQLPVMLWSWTKPHSMADGNVCLSTSGLEPFLGHELEVWNAALPCDEVRDQMSDLIVYLLDNGPVIGHGDTAGRTKGDKAIRCFLGPSRAERDQPVQALFLEFGDTDALVVPKADVAAAAPVASDDGFDGVLQDFLDRACDRDTTGMSDVIRDMLAGERAERAAAAVVQAAAVAGTASPADAQDGLVAYVALTRAIGFPVDDVLEQLAQAVPDARWTRDASDQGLRVPRTLTGARNGDDIVVTIVASGAPLPAGLAGAPDHACHVRLTVATGGDSPLAMRIAAIVAAGLVVGQDTGAQAQVRGGSAWVRYDALLGLMSAAKFGAIDHLVGGAPVALAPAAPLRRVGGFGRKGL